MNPNPNNTRFISICVTILGFLCLLIGGALTYKGYNAELLIGGGTSAIAGLLGVLSNRSSATPQPTDTTTAEPPKP